MKTLMAALILATVAPLTANADVGKEEIKKLMKAGFEESAILNYIRANAPAARLSSDDMIDLKAAGASDAILKEMITASIAVVIEVPPPVPVVSETPAARHFRLPAPVVETVVIVPQPRLVFSYSVWGGSCRETCEVRTQCRSWSSGCEPARVDPPCRSYDNCSRGAYRNRACWRR